MHCLPTPQLRHPLRFICRHLGGGGLGEGSKDLIGFALAIGDLPWLHEGETGVGGGVNSGICERCFYCGVDFAQRAVVAAGPGDGIGANLVGDAWNDGAGIAGSAQKLHPTGGKLLR